MTTGSAHLLPKRKSTHEQVKVSWAGEQWQWSCVQGPPYCSCGQRYSAHKCESSHKSYLLARACERISYLLLNFCSIMPSYHSKKNTTSTTTTPCNLLLSGPVRLSEYITNPQGNRTVARMLAQVLFVCMSSLRPLVITVMEWSNLAVALAACTTAKHLQIN